MVITSFHRGDLRLAYVNYNINKEGSENMSEEKKRLIKETVENLKLLDRESLIIVRSGAEMLKSRDLIGKTEKSEGKKKQDKEVV